MKFKLKLYIIEILLTILAIIGSFIMTGYVTTGNSNINFIVVTGGFVAGIHAVILFDIFGVEYILMQ